MTTCDVPGCNRDTEGLSVWCKPHYMRVYFKGEPGTAEVRPYGASLEELFWRKVDKTDDCWMWTASVVPKGYGSFKYRGKWYSAHRLAYELLVGPIPEGLQLDHLCREKRCVNPAHLEPVTNAENMRRANVLVTHCKRGHEFTPENTYWYTNPRRRGCRICIRAAGRETMRRRRARLRTAASG